MPNTTATPKLEPSWQAVLEEEFNKPYFADITAHLLHEQEAGETVYPPTADIFNAFNACPFKDVKVIIL
jgi:uracil-DNA glycosylase